MSYKTELMWVGLNNHQFHCARCDALILPDGEGKVTIWTVPRRGEGETGSDGVCEACYKQGAAR